MIFLLILKIIGIILLSILGLVLLMLALILFYPIIYRIDGSACDKNYFIRIKARWIFNVFGLEAGYKDKDIFADYRIFFWKKNLLEDDEEDDEYDVAESEELEKDAKELENAKINQTESEELEEDAKELENAKINEAELKKDEEVPDNTKTRETEFGESDTEEKISGIVKLKSFFNGVKKIYKKYDRIKNNARYQKAIEHLKIELKKLIKAISPYKFCGNVSFSTGQPDLTGKVLGVYAMLPFVYKNKGKVIPDFVSDEAYVEGDIMIKGRIFLVSILMIGIRLWLDKNCRKLYNYITR